MLTQLEFPLVLVPEFWSYVLSMLSSTAGTVPAPLKGCIVGLSTNPLNFTSAEALANSIALPPYNGYAASGAQDFGAALDRPDGGWASSMPSVLFRQTSGGTTRASGIAALWFLSPASGVYGGGCNFPSPLPIVGVGDGFSALLQLVLGASNVTGKVVIVGSDALVTKGASGPGGGAVIGQHFSMAYTTAGTDAWICPPGVYSVRSRATGASAGVSSGGASVGVAGAGAGAYAEEIIPTVPGTSYNVVRGAAGVGASSVGSTTSGGDSMFAAGAACLAKGGSKSVDGGAGGIGGLLSGCVGSIKFAGGNGGAGNGSLGGGGGGGGAASGAGQGNNGAAAAGAVGGAGGAALVGGGSGGNGGNSGVNGTAGSSPGGGPGGPGNLGVFRNGQPGQVLLDWVVQ